MTNIKNQEKIIINFFFSYYIKVTFIKIFINNLLKVLKLF